MAGDKTPSVHALEKPEKLQDLLKADRGDDCTPCRVVGKFLDLFRNSHLDVPSLPISSSPSNPRSSDGPTLQQQQSRDSDCTSCRVTGTELAPLRRLALVVLPTATASLLVPYPYQAHAWSRARNG